MKKLVFGLLIVAVGVTVALAVGPRKWVGTVVHQAGTTASTANRRDSTDFWLGSTLTEQALNSASLYVTVGAAHVDTYLTPSGIAFDTVFTKRGFGLQDTVIIRLITRGTLHPRQVISSSSAVDSTPLSIPLGIIGVDTTFKSEVGFCVVTSDSTSDTTITAVFYPVKYELIMSE